MRYRVVPWRGYVTGNVYYRIERAGFLLWREVLTCFSEQEANDMLAKLRGWDIGQPSALPSAESGTTAPTPLKAPLSQGSGK